MSCRQYCIFSTPIQKQRGRPELKLRDGPDDSHPDGW